MKKAVCICLICIFFLVSCGKTAGADAFFEAFSMSFVLPKGLVYRKTSGATEADLLSRKIFDTLYATAPDTDYYDEIKEGVVWLGASSERICEMAVFLCPDRESAEEIAFMCSARIELLRSLHSGVDSGYTADARVVIYGKAVFMCALPDNGQAQRIAKRLLT